MRRALFVLVVVFSSTPALAAPAGAEAGAGPFDPASGYSLDEAGLRKVAEALRKDIGAFVRLRPDVADARALARKESDAIRLYHGAHSEISWLIKNMKLPAKHAVKLASWSLRDPEVTPVFSKLARRKDAFREDLTFWVMVFPQEEKSAVIRGFVAQGGRWVLYPMPARILDDQSYPDEAAALFIGLIQTGRFDQAYDLLSTHLHERMTREGFATAIRATGLPSIRSVKEETHGWARIVGRSIVRRTFLVEMDSGQQAALTIYVSLDGAQSRILYFDQRASFGIGGPSLYLPPVEACRALVRKTLGLAIEAFTTGKVEALTEASAESLRQELTAERLREVFAEHLKAPERFDFVGEGRVTWTQRPEILKVDHKAWHGPDLLDQKPRGPLVMQGYVVSQDGSQHAGFALRFRFKPAFKGGTWEILGLQLQMPEPVERAPR